ncbi:hypothetical protein Cpir12675_000342 [Ceratocystis pirilliformis]|uniref:Arrestin C-terminal-like domain-containing protein n=1 Tax=Ceratocystis pirilliformis TaxID=259994 RepID=A0ABR3ZNB6_9PEZI
MRLKPFSSKKSTVTLFQIRLDNDFIVFRGGEDESSGQVLKGHLVLCLSAPLRVDDIHLDLAGTIRFSWAEARHTGASVTGPPKVDRTISLLSHRFPSFIGGKGKNITLEAGNYEWPFEYMLPGNTAETIECVPEVSLTYRLTATCVRNKLVASDVHTQKRFRVIRTLDPTALEFHHAMSVENIWPNKIEYSLAVPQKAVPLGSHVGLEMRFTPLLKGLDLGDITAKLIEIRECSISTSASPNGKKEYKTERCTETWKFPVTHEAHWRDTIEGTGQEGWYVEKKLPLPKKLRQCVQDLHHHGIKIRHKMKLTVSLKNPDGHISELRATLPVSIFISPSLPMDEQGNLVNQSEGAADSIEEDINANAAPPGYGDHILDQIYEDADNTTTVTTPVAQSGVSSPQFYSQSRIGSSEDLHSYFQPGTASSGASPSIVVAAPPAPAAAATTIATSQNQPTTPATTRHGVLAAALTSRLQEVSMANRRNTSSSSLASLAAAAGIHTSRSQSHSNAHSNGHSNAHSTDGDPASGCQTPDFDPELAMLSQVPSYETAVKTPARSYSYTGGMVLPDYQTVLSAPSTPTTEFHYDSLFTIPESTSRLHASMPGSRTTSSHPSRTTSFTQLHTLHLRNHSYSGSPMPPRTQSSNALSMLGRRRHNDNHN